MAFIKWLIALPFIIGAVAFAIANPEPVSIIWSPLHDPVTLPLYAVALAFLGGGFFLGALMTWFGMGKVRAERRGYKKEVKALEKEIKEIKANKEKPSSKDPLLKQIEKDQKELESLIP